MFLKVSPLKEIMRFGKKEKISPQFFSLYEILKHFKEVAYELDLPPKLAAVHLVFYVSMLKCIGDSSLVFPFVLESRITFPMKKSQSKFLIGNSRGKVIRMWCQ